MSSECDSNTSQSINVTNDKQSTEDTSKTEQTDHCEAPVSSTQNASDDIDPQLASLVLWVLIVHFTLVASVN